MNLLYRLQGSEFEWDSHKADRNLVKHGISFHEAAEVFFDPFYVSGDASHDHEAREFILGYSLSQRMLLVVYTERGIRNRIISARPATRRERRMYDSG